MTPSVRTLKGSKTKGFRGAPLLCPRGSNARGFTSAEEHHIFMSQNTRSFGRTELATHYFPNIKPMSAWLKLKALLLENPDLEPLTQLKRRTFSPAEVNKIYQALGQP